MRKLVLIATITLLPVAIGGFLIGVWLVLTEPNPYNRRGEMEYWGGTLEDLLEKSK